MRNQLPTIYEDIQLTIEEYYNDAPILEFDSIMNDKSCLPILIPLLLALMVISVVLLIYSTTIGLYCLLVTTILGLLSVAYEIICNQ